MKRIVKKNQIIITALAIMIAVAGYLNYSGSKLDLASTNAGTDGDALALDISSEDQYAQTGLEETLPAWTQIWRIWSLQSLPRERRRERRYLPAPLQTWDLPLRQRFPGNSCVLRTRKY